MDPSLWNLFHDGTVAAAEGSVPGDVALVIECQYLRRMFATPGESFLVRLRGCTVFEYVPYDELPVTEVAAVGELEPELLSAEPGDPLEICCVGGILRVAYREWSLTLDSGEPVSLEQLDEVSNRYWDNWEQRNAAAP